jgi:hypothetical protein
MVHDVRTKSASLIAVGTNGARGHFVTRGRNPWEVLTFTFAPVTTRVATGCRIAARGLGHRTVMRVLAVLAMLVGLHVVRPATAHADEGYRTEMAVVDGTSAGLLVGGATIAALAKRGTWFGLGITAAVIGSAGIFYGAPIVHGSHDHLGRAFGSFGLRAGGFALPWVVAVASRPSFDGRGHGLSGASLGLTSLALMGIGIAIDYALVGASESSPAPRTRMMSFGFAF